MEICNISRANRKQSTVWVLAMGLILVLGACSTSDDPTDPVTDPPPGDVDLDPGSGLVDLKAIHLIGPDGMMIPISLLGGELLVQDGGTLTLDVAMRNDGPMDLIPPLVLWIGEFDPESVTITNADTLMNESDATLPLMFGFDYSTSLGTDEVLSPGEMTGIHTWTFTDPDLVPFSFTGWAEGGFGPPPAFMGGFVFDDLNYNGVRDTTEPPLSNVPLRVRYPDDFEMFVMSGSNGEFDVMTNQVGLYEVSVDFPPDMLPGSPWVTTANPLFVTLIPGPDGRPMDFLDMEFGVADFDGDFPPPPMPLIFSTLSPTDLQQGEWTLVMGEVFDDFMFHADVDYFGCQPGHHFVLYATGVFVPGATPRQVITLVDEMDETCGTLFDQNLMFDLWPIKDAYVAEFGYGDLDLDFVGFDGTVLATYSIHINNPSP